MRAATPDAGSVEPLGVDLDDVQVGIDEKDLWIADRSVGLLPGALQRLDGVRSISLCREVRDRRAIARDTDREVDVARIGHGAMPVRGMLAHDEVQLPVAELEPRSGEVERWTWQLR